MEFLAKTQFLSTNLWVRYKKDSNFDMTLCYWIRNKVHPKKRNPRKVTRIHLRETCRLEVVKAWAAYLAYNIASPTLPREFKSPRRPSYQNYSGSRSLGEMSRGDGKISIKRQKQRSWWRIDHKKSIDLRFIPTLAGAKWKEEKFKRRRTKTKTRDEELMNHWQRETGIACGRSPIFWSLIAV